MFGKDVWLATLFGAAEVNQPERDVTSTKSIPSSVNQRCIVHLWKANRVSLIFQVNFSEDRGVDCGYVASPDTPVAGGTEGSINKARTVV